jgi:twitching motility two-component system response regulator PilH
MAVVLIVDDSPTELHLFQTMLEKAGFDTLVADSGEEGIRQASVSKPDCILMDVVKYLVKPVADQELVDKINSVMAA